MSHHYGDRQSGRTKAMLEAVLKAVREGKEPLVVIARHNLEPYCRALLSDVLGATPDEQRKVKFLVPSPRAAQRLAGTDPDQHPLLWDHYFGEEGAFDRLVLDGVDQRRRQKTRTPGGE